MDWEEFIKDCAAALFLAAFICLIGIMIVVGVYTLFHMGKLGVVIMIAYLTIFIALVIKAWIDHKY